jgi:peptidoglycan hydrolase-like protein with peptidoglycan-binding domain
VRRRKQEEPNALAWTFAILGLGSLGIWLVKDRNQELSRWVPEQEKRAADAARRAAMRAEELAKEGLRKIETEAKRFSFPSISPYLPKVPRVPMIANAGSFVRQVQAALTSAGFPTGGIDGDWGTATTKAAMGYQNSKGLPATGNPEPSLLASLGVGAPPVPASLAGLASALVQGAAGLLQDPLDALRLFLYESGLSPTIENHHGFPSGVFAVGIFQILNTYLTTISVDAFKALGVVGQVPYAFQNWRGKFAANHVPVPASGRDLYWVNFLPASYKPGAADDYVIVKSDDTYQRPNGIWAKLSNVYSANNNMDSGSKGFITAGDLKAIMTRGPRGANAPLYAAIANVLPTNLVA